MLIIYIFILSFIKKIKGFALIEIIISLILLTRETIHYLGNRSIEDPFNGLVIEFEKYKEDSYFLFFLWLLLMFAGIFLFKIKRIGWILNKSFLLFVFVFLFLIVLSNFNNLSEIFLILLFTLIVIVILILMYNKFFLKTLNIHNIDKVISVVLGVSLYLSYWYIYFVLF